MIPHDTHLQIGSLLFEGIDQIDLTGPFEVLSRIPNSTYRLYGKTAEPVRDLKGLRLTPDAALSRRAATRCAACPRRLRPGSADGGRGGSRLDPAAGGRARERVLGLHRRAALRRGGAAKGRRATTHWASFHLLPLFGAIPVNERVVVDGNWVFAAGVTAGIDGALRLAAELRGDDAARRSSSTWSMRRSRPSTAARPRRRLPPSSPGAAIGGRHHRATRGDRPAGRQQTRHHGNSRGRMTSRHPAQ